MSGGSSRSLEVVDVDMPTRSRKSTSAKRVRKDRPTAERTTTAKTAKRTGTAKRTSAAKGTPLKKKTAQRTAGRPSSLDTNTSFEGLRREPLGHLLVEKKLREAGFRGTCSTDKLILDAYATDESIFSIRPQIVLQPESKRDVEIAVCVIAEDTKCFGSLSLTPRAAGTGLSGGSLTDSVVIDVAKHLKRIEDPKVKKSGVTVTCEPGAYFSDVEDKLKKHGVYLPSVPASKDICSIGGSVANNAAGADSLKYGQTADWIQSLDVVLRDGKTYTVKPMTYKELQKLMQKKTAYGEIAKKIFTLIERNEKAIYAARPKTRKNTAGFALWNVLSHPVSEFKDGTGTFDLTKLIAGSQGTIGIVTSVTLKTAPVPTDTTLIVLPIFDLDCAGRAILQSLEYEPVNIEIFDGLSFDLALKSPDFFKDRVKGFSYYKVMFALYTMYHVRYRRQTPEFTLLVTIDNVTLKRKTRREVVTELQSCGCNVVRFVKSPEEREMWWQVRRASYSLSKLQEPTKRPAAFLEDMTVPPQNLFGFFADIKKLFKKYNITAALHGHGGNGHFHFYPLVDFEKKGTAKLIEEMANEFFDTATKYDGSLCGEHNDGIIRSPHLSKMFDKNILELFKQIEHIFDPDDIFNPGKKVNPRFDIKDSIRKTN